MQIVRNDGQLATVTQRISRMGSPDQLVLSFDDGTSLTIAEDVLIQNEDGTYLIPLDQTMLTDMELASLDNNEQIVVPVIKEELQVTKESVERSMVRVTTKVDSHEEVIDEPLLYEWVSVDRVPVNQLIENIPDVREENGVMVIPIIEEVLVIEKKILLREEVRLTKHKATVRKPQRVVLRSQMVEIERFPTETTDNPSI
ncbi:YsnF/AvaK domain-containing protein [Aphanothece hegewaldii]|uniref:YsnF/AvaK domain-containing protein n=1 Tax=Aphanothece hegewaldii TaxID=1521625 RepID=UPI0015E7BF5A|nr:YsnF/AvaK domain-containing protein [Aphanothece hegewaldii]